jgi:hypothetical protein
MALKEGTWQWWLDLPSELRDQWLESLRAMMALDGATPEVVVDAPAKRDTTGAWQALCEQLCQLAEWATLLAEEDGITCCVSSEVFNYWLNGARREKVNKGLECLSARVNFPPSARVGHYLGSRGESGLPEPVPVETGDVNGREIEVETPVVKMPPPERTDGLRIKLRCPGCGVPWVFSLVEPLEHECKNCHRIFAPPAYTGGLP